MKRSLVTLCVFASAVPASAQISRTEVLDRARAYVYYPWTASAANQTAACVADYESAYYPGDQLGVAYDWGGFSSLFNFDQKIAQGYGAGSPAFGDVYACTVGVDCSGFVSRAWHTSQKYGTATIHQVSSTIPVGQLLVGDAFNKASYHIAMFTRMLSNGEPYMLEAVGYNTHVNATGGWSYVEGFLPTRFDSITGTTAATPQGTLNEPLTVSSFPYSDSRNTAESLSDLLDGCGAQPGTSESGPEYVYKVVITQPGTLTASVSDDAGADIDVHLYESWNTSDCVARHDSALSRQLDCGTYYVVADTYGSDSNAGNYDISMTFAPSGASCGAGLPAFNPSGGFGEACGYPGNENLPFCNPTLNGDVCLYTSGAGSTSFCTAACATDADCSGMSGGCCADIGDGEFYCVTAALCPENGGGGESPEDPAPGDDPEAPGSGEPPGEMAGPNDEGSGGCRYGSGDSAPSLALLALAFAFCVRRRRA